MLFVENILSHLRSAACYHGWALFCHGWISFGLLTAMPAFATMCVGLNPRVLLSYGHLFPAGARFFVDIYSPH